MKEIKTKVLPLDKPVDGVTNHLNGLDAKSVSISSSTICQAACHLIMCRQRASIN